jgi:hypothetical protein
MADAQTAPDAFQSMLDTLGLEESDLGFHPRGYWLRFPDPRDIPYQSLAFQDLFAEPHHIYEFVRAMALAAEDFLYPDYLASHEDALLKIGYYTGIRHHTAQFRAYSASLWADLDPEEPLLMAVKKVYVQTHRVFQYNAMGKASDFPLIENELRRKIGAIDPDIRRILAEALLNLLEAWRFRQTALRNVDMQDALACWRIRDLGETQFDGLEYYPQLEDCARNLDRNSLYYAGYKVLGTGERLARQLQQILQKKKIDHANQRLDIDTPIGRVLLAATGKDRHAPTDAILLVDLGGNDIYTGAAGATPSLDIPIQLTVDIQGNDQYLNDNAYLPAQGAAVLGAALLLDLEGDDIYQSRKLSQGAALLGMGVLADLQGDDRYEMETSGQGGAYFGVGLAVDILGNDTYEMHGDGQGYGGVGGIGTLLNGHGDDRYRTEPLASKVFRPDYHSKDGQLNYSYAQGCGVGRRGDITDGHAWAGGMGTLIDLTGDDHYESANWSLGCGYWFGMGFVYEGSGNDTYTSASWSQGSGAHFCIGALIDEEGNDRHTLWEERSEGLCFAHDYTIALFMDRKGNDVYRLKDSGLSRALNMSQVFFFELEGDDIYITSGRGMNFGSSNFDPQTRPGLTSFYHLFSHQISLFADLQGNDTYQQQEYPSGEDRSDPRMNDGALQKTVQPFDTDGGPGNYQIARDFSSEEVWSIRLFRDRLGKQHRESR